MSEQVCPENQNSCQQNKVLLVNYNQCKIPYEVFPLGIAYLQKSLNKHGYKTAVYDMCFESKSLESVIGEFKPDCIGISLRNIDDVRVDNTTIFVDGIDRLTDQIRTICSVPVVLGGSAFSLFPEKILELSKADFGIYGEGETSFPLLLSKITGSNSSLPLESIPGLVFRDSSFIKKNNRKFAEVFDSGPYRDPEITGFYTGSSGILNIQTQRGCPYTCCYCTYPLLEGVRSRYMPAPGVINDFLAAKQAGAKYVFITDSVLNTSSSHVADICEELIKIKFDIPWGCFLRPAEISPDLMKLMARAGLKHIEFGSESFSDSVLDSYSKMFTFDDILKSSELAFENDIHYSHFLIIGGPGESESTLLETYQNSLFLKKTAIFPFTGMRIYPGTNLHSIALQEGYIEKTDDLFSPSFYFSPLISKEEIDNKLYGFSKSSRRWLINSPLPEHLDIMRKLQKKGYSGPLWEYLTT